jgi:hypothetical protein
MPKDEFDFDDPMELNGVAFLTDEDTTTVMAECFIEEFMRMGYNDKQILALFRNPHYIGMNMVLQKRGEQFILGLVSDTFARWGKPVGKSEIQDLKSETQQTLTPAPANDLDPTEIDPTGAPIPRLNQ